MFAVDGVKVWNAVLAVEHANDDAEESRDLRHYPFSSGGTKDHGTLRGRHMALLRRGRILRQTTAATCWSRLDVVGKGPVRN